MITFICALAALVIGYLIYGKTVDKLFGADPSRGVPAKEMADGVDYVPLPTWKVFMIQFLNIAGTGPIFGAIMGILFGPAAYIWIVCGSIFIGGVHDYMTGMISVRNKGVSLPDVVGGEFGKGMKMAMRVFSLILLVLVGTVFTTTSAGLLAELTPTSAFWGSKSFWVVLIFIYFVLATILPIDTLIGRFYPIFGAALLIMAFGVLAGIFTRTGYMPEIGEAFTSHHPKGLPIFPMLFVTIACGAVSGFHGTQSPLMARCIKSEKYGRPVFYGAMVTEGVVALIWAAAAIKFSGSYEALLDNLTGGNPAGGTNPAMLVNFICQSWMGRVGAILAVLGVVAAPITSGDTAFRSARLILADFLKVKNNKLAVRLLLALPVFAVSLVLLSIDFDVLWRYFAWSNQVLAAIGLWAFTAYQKRQGRPCMFCAIPAIFMTAVCASYFFISPEGMHLGRDLSYILGAVVTVALVAFNHWWLRSCCGGKK